MEGFPSVTLLVPFYIQELRLEGIKKFAHVLKARSCTFKGQSVPLCCLQAPNLLLSTVGGPP